MFIVDFAPSICIINHTTITRTKQKQTNNKSTQTAHTTKKSINSKQKTIFQSSDNKKHNIFLCIFPSTIHIRVELNKIIKKKLYCMGGGDGR